MKKKLTITALFTLMLTLLTTTSSYANYQIIPTGNSATNYPINWLTDIRKMESANQVMGLTETIDTTTGLATSESNNIDVHVMKNTEYGAVLILGISEYGKQNVDEDGYMHQGSIETSGTDVKATTTGNVYGVYELGYNNMNMQ